MIEKNMLETLEKMVDEKLVKVGLPGNGTLAEKIARLERNGFAVEGKPVEKKVSGSITPILPKVETSIEVENVPQQPKRGRPKKGK